jgi:hypothetical protein
MHKASILLLLAALTAAIPAGAQTRAPAVLVLSVADTIVFRPSDPPSSDTGPIRLDEVRLVSAPGNRVALSVAVSLRAVKF